MVATYGLFYIMTTWILSYAIGKVELGCLGVGYRDFLVLQLISVAPLRGLHSGGRPSGRPARPPQVPAA